MSNENIYPKKAGSGKVFVGLLLLLIGGLLLLQQFTYFSIPWWFWRWPTWLILIGLWSGAKHNFRNIGSIIMIVIGMAFLIDDIFPDIDLSRVIWPIVLMIFGVYVIFGRHQRFERNFLKKKWRDNNPQPWEANYVVPPDGATSADPIDPLNPTAQAYSSANQPTGDDYISTTSVFGSVNRTILSKDFKGGDIVNVFGGTEINFTQADIAGRVYIDVTQLFGGIKLIVPPHWQVTSDIAAVFAGIDDKRRPGAIPLSADKILVLKGTSIFAGIEIRSF